MRFVPFPRFDISQTQKCGLFRLAITDSFPLKSDVWIAALRNEALQTFVQAPPMNNGLTKRNVVEYLVFEKRMWYQLLVSSCIRRNIQSSLLCDGLRLASGVV